MTQEKRDRLIERIKKLVRLAGDKSNEHEAALAAERVQSILAEYNLSMSEVNAAQDEDGKIIEAVLRTPGYLWTRMLAAAVAKLYFTEHFFIAHPKPGGNIRSGYFEHYFIGKAHNVEVSKQMFIHLKDTIERLAKEGAKKFTGSRASYITSFTNAAATRMHWRIHERIEAAKKGEVVSENTGTTLPALANLYDTELTRVQQYMDGHHRLRTVHSRMGNKSWQGAADGTRAANNIGLDDQVARGKVKAIK